MLIDVDLRSALREHVIVREALVLAENDLWLVFGRSQTFGTCVGALFRYQRSNSKCYLYWYHLICAVHFTLLFYDVLIFLGLGVFISDGISLLLI